MQRSFDDLGTPLSDVTFCVIDLETTGASAGACGITEIGAVKVRGGECLGTFQTLVNPGLAIPPEITILTGITQAMVMPAPRIEYVLPSLLEFIGEQTVVVVGHNVRFDLSFLNAALERSSRPPLAYRSVDTCALARRLVRDEVPNCKLGTLVERLRLDHRSSHRALDDALATTDLLHVLIERAASWGVYGLDDLMALPKMAAHPQAHKLRLTNSLPRTPGVYMFKDPSGRILYVGKATNLRSRVRSYFSSDERKKVAQLLREVHSIDHIECGSVLEAEVLEVRLIHQHEPRFNRQAKLWRQYAYVKLTLTERFPRLTVVKIPKPDGALYLGPLASMHAARLVIEAIESVVPLRRCASRQRRGPRAGARTGECTAAQLGVAVCPCTGSVSEKDYAEIVARTRRGLLDDPQLLLEPLRERMHRLAVEERFEEAASVRDRADALAGALRRQRRMESLRRAGSVLLALPDQRRVELYHGIFVRSWIPTEAGTQLELLESRGDDQGGTVAGGPFGVESADELACVAAFLDREADHLRMIHCEGELALPTRPVQSFAQGPRRKP